MMIVELNKLHARVERESKRSQRVLRRPARIAAMTDDDRPIGGNQLSATLHEALSNRGSGWCLARVAQSCTLPYRRLSICPAPQELGAPFTAMRGRLKSA